MTASSKSAVSADGHARPEPHGGQGLGGQVGGKAGQVGGKAGQIGGKAGQIVEAGQVGEAGARANETGSQAGEPGARTGAPDNGTTNNAAPKDNAASPRKVHLRYTTIILALMAALVLAMLVAIGIGPLVISPVRVAQILWNDALQALGLGGTSDTPWTAGERSAVSLVRAPRIVLAVLVGGALAISGATLQALFRNPLVSPDVIGVSSASAFGGVLMILLGMGSGPIVSGAFASGLIAVGLVMLIARIPTGSPILTIVLGGIVVSAFFNALVSLVTYLADPYTTLPSITFWLMGSFAAATWEKVVVIIVPVLLGLVVVVALRWRINILSLGDDEAISLGINPARMRAVLIVAVALLTASTVASVGIVGWVGLVVPHLIRLLVGHDNRIVIPASFLLGGIYTLIIDTLARSLSTVEVPVGILTAMLGAPVFITVLIRRTRHGGSLA